MFIRRLELEEFRSYRHLDLRLEPAGLRLVGPNASGKSTLLEAVAMLATTRSPRTTTERDVINWRSGEEFGLPPFVRIRGDVVRGDDETTVEIGMQVDAERPTATKKRIRVDERAVRSSGAVGRLRAVLFSPEDVALVTNPPAARRRYLDLTIAQIDPAYLRALARYARVLEQRNSLLKALHRERVAPRSPQAAGQLAFWDQQLVAEGAQVIAGRARFVDLLTARARERFAELSPQGTFDVVYRSSVDVRSNTGTASVSTAAIARDFQAQLESVRDDEARRGMSVVGPHRDDLGLLLEGVDLAAFGSRGQQRLAVVALKLAEIDVMTDVGGEPPVLLLDDVLSELDPRHRRLLREAAARGGAQVLVTTTDEREVVSPEFAHIPLARLEPGVGIVPATD
jgi:DNA replication and repair protein RecF